MSSSSIRSTNMVAAGPIRPMFLESRSDACVTKLLNMQGWEYRSLHRANVMT